MKIKRFLAVLIVFVLSFVGVGKIFDILDKNLSLESHSSEDTIEDNAINVSENEYLILLVGVDKNSSEIVNEDFTRTDTIMLLKADTRDGTIKLLSIPRDTRIKVRNSFDKVNHAHAFGGIELTMQTLRNFLGLDIDYYVQVNYQGLINIIDALGGVDYEVPEGVSIDRGSGIKIDEGKNHFDGELTMWYLRTRNIYNNGDIGRVNAQQDFVKAMVDQAVEKSKDINLMTFISNYIRYVKTNLPMTIIYDLARNISKFSSDKVDTMIVPGMEETIYGTSYYIPDFEKTWQLVRENFPSFRLENWTKEDSGYQNYEDFGRIIDQSGYKGLSSYEEYENELMKNEEGDSSDDR